MCQLDMVVLHYCNDEKTYIKMFSLNIDDVEINILKNNSDSTPDRNFELIEDYAFVLNEINYDIKLPKQVENIESLKYNNRRQNNE